jgi:N utilization substance protein B
MATDASSPRRQNRILAAQFLYSWSINPGEGARELADYVDEFIGIYGADSCEFYGFARELAIGSVENLQTIDKLIEAHAQNWTIPRIAKVDLAILRLALYEMLFREDIPPIVSMNEAIELGKELSSDESNRFINGVLDKVRGTLSRHSRTAKK